MLSKAFSTLVKMRKPKTFYNKNIKENKNELETST